MYQNFDEKYVSIVYDEGSSATLTQTTLAYWDFDYGKKVLTSDEQLNMYLKPSVSPVIKYLMYDNMEKLVDAHAFVRVEKVEDALFNVKYNFYTKRNVRYSIVFPSQFKNINLKYLNDFELLYKRLEDALKLDSVPDSNNADTPSSNDVVNNESNNDIEEVSTQEVKEIIQIDSFDIDSNSTPTNFKESFENSLKLEEKQAHIKEENASIEEKYEFEPKPLKKHEEKSRVIFNDDTSNKTKTKTKVDKGNLDSILESLDLE